MAYAHIVFLILKVQSDTLLVRDSPMALSIRGWGVLRYIHIHRFGTLIWVQNFRQIFGGGGGYEEIVDFLGGWVWVITKLRYFGGSFLYILGLLMSR